MLSDIMLTRARLGYDRVDVHRYATFSCGVSRFFRRMGRWFG
ncbi:hypothetical protein [Afifella sp. IM 167]|nr:hypothetical protein [Afifella sp. IM 167]